MKTLIKISAWILIIFGLLFLVVSMILTIASVIRIGNPGVAARLLQSRIPVLLSMLFQGLLLVGVGEVLFLLLSVNKNLLSDPISNNGKTDPSVKKKITR
jgi:membrane protein implicated in regulation of membrane protease activity